MPKLEHVLQALIDSAIPITITGLWDNGFDFCFASLKNAIAHDTDHPEDIERNANCSLPQSQLA
jgi:hypothetical protein